MGRVFKTNRNPKSKARKSSPKKPKSSVNKAGVIPHFVTRHVRKGDIVEIIRCSKCAGFLSKNTKVCKGCITKENGGSIKQKRKKLLSLQQKKPTSPKSKQIKVTPGKANKSKAAGPRRSRAKSTVEKSDLAKANTNKAPAKKRSRSESSKRKQHCDCKIGEINKCSNCLLTKSKFKKSDYPEILDSVVELTRLDETIVSKYIGLPQANNAVDEEDDFVDVEFVGEEDILSLYDSLDYLINNSSNHDH